MNIHVYSVIWNEELIIPYFLRHYSKFAKITLINHHCTDQTLSIAKGKARILDYPFDRPFTEGDHSAAFEWAYKKYSRKADWVICVDADEFLYEPVSQLSLLSGIVKPVAYMMISEKPPTTDEQIYDEIKTGVRMRSFDKPVMFNPQIDVIFGNGRHTAEARWNGMLVQPVQSRIKLLHYKYLGKEYYFERSRLVYPRKDKTDEVIDYRLKKGLRWYDEHIGAENVI